jgi:hypothetical protein
MEFASKVPVGGPMKPANAPILEAVAVAGSIIVTAAAVAPTPVTGQVTVLLIASASPASRLANSYFFNAFFRVLRETFGSERSWKNSFSIFFEIFFSSAGNIPFELKKIYAFSIFIRNVLF